jgi:hypothetical protein
VEGFVPSETEEETAHRMRAGDVGVPATLGGLYAPTEGRTFILCNLLWAMVWKGRLMVVRLDRLVPYEGIAQGERS